MSNALKNAGTRFPFINLQKAIERAKLLYDADQRGREMGVTAAFGVWGYSEKSSGGFQTVAALKGYGLLKEGNGTDARKVALSEDALRYFRDERPDEKLKLLKVFALKPKLIAVLWDEWGATPPADTIARSHLKTEVGLNDQSARSLLAVYKENATYAELKGGDKVVEIQSEKDDDSGNGVDRQIETGDLIQVEIGGVYQLPQPAKVRAIQEHGGQTWVFVEGSEAGIPMEQAVLEQKGSPSPPMAPPARATPPMLPLEKPPAPTSASLPRVIQDGKLLSITAVVDLKGLKKLKLILDNYEKLLEMFEDEESATSCDGNSQN